MFKLNFKVHEPRDEIPVRYYQKLTIALFCICAPLGIYANMQTKEVKELNRIKYRFQMMVIMVSQSAMIWNY